MADPSALALATLTSVFVMFFIPAFQQSVTTTVTEVSGTGITPMPEQSIADETGPISVHQWVGPFALIGAAVPILLTAVSPKQRPWTSHLGRRSRR